MPDTPSPIDIITAALHGHVEEYYEYTTFDGTVAEDIQKRLIAAGYAIIKVGAVPERMKQIDRECGACGHAVSNHSGGRANDECSVLISAGPFDPVQCDCSAANDS